MEIGIVGLGRMGGNIARRLMQAGHRAVVWDKDAAAVAALAAEGAVGVTDLAGLVAALTPPRAVWVMLPHGAPTEDALEQLRRPRHGVVADLLLFLGEHREHAVQVRGREPVVAKDALPVGEHVVRSAKTKG